MLTTEKGSTQRFRDAWEQEANIALERAGRDERIDKRSLVDQGIDREAQLRVGAGAQNLAGKEHEFRSAEKEITRLIDGVPTTVTVNYPIIDEGKTRAQENEDRIQRNLDRARELAEVALEGEKLQAYYSAATAALNSVPGEKAWTEADRFENFQAAMRAFKASPQDDSDPLTSIVGEHLAARTKEQVEEDRIFWHLEAPLEKGGADDGERGPRRDAADLLAGGGLAIFSKLSDALESFFDSSPTREEGKEQQMAEKKSASQPTIEQRTEQQQRAHEAELAADRNQELQAYLDQRSRERGIDRGR